MKLAADYAEDVVAIANTPRMTIGQVAALAGVSRGRIRELDAIFEPERDVVTGHRRYLRAWVELVLQVRARHGTGRWIHPNLI